MVRLKKKTKKRLTQCFAVLLCVLMLLPIILNLIPQKDEAIENQQILIEEIEESMDENDEKTQSSSDENIP